MEEASDNEHEPAPVASFTMAQAYFKAIMVEKEQSEHPTPRASAFQMFARGSTVQPTILKQHRLTEGQITGVQANEDTVASMFAENPTFLDEHRALYDSMRSAHAIRHGRWRLLVMEAERDTLFEELTTRRAIMDRNVANVGSSVPFTSGHNDHSAGLSTSLVDLTLTGDVRGHAADSGEKWDMWETKLSTSGEEYDMGHKRVHGWGRF